MLEKNNALLGYIHSFILENLSCQFNINLFTAIIIRNFVFIYKFCCLLLQINN